MSDDLSHLGRSSPLIWSFRLPARGKRDSVPIVWVVPARRSPTVAVTPSETEIMDTDFPALREAIANDVENVTLRVHLCDLLIEHGRFDEALAEIRGGLGYAPDDVALLGLATRVLNRVGNCELARKYERVLDAVIDAAVIDEIPAPAPTPPLAAPRQDDPETTPEARNRRHDDPKQEARNRRHDDPKPTVSVPPAATPPPDRTDATASEPATGSVIHDLRDGSVPAEASAKTPVEPATETAAITDVAPRSWETSIEPGRRLIEIRQPWTSLDRLVGMTKLRGDLYAFCDHPVTTKRSGLLLWGPPGCGKATYADACAGTLERSVVHVHVAEAVETWLVKGRHEIAAIFAEAEANAPCVLFLDGLDALCGHASLAAQALREFMTRLDTLVRNGGDRVAVVATTQRPWLLNRNVIEPHRLGTQLLVQAPDAEARAAIIREQLADRPIGRIDTEGLAAATANYSAAELVFVCELATEYAIFDSIDAGKSRPITMQDLVRAIDETAPSTTEWFRTAREHATNSNATDLRK